MAKPAKRQSVHPLWWLIHIAIIANFLIEMVYAAYLIFVVVAPPGGGPLGARAADFPFEKMVTRRLYAMEFWQACSGLAIYLAITEVAPRFWLARDESSPHDS